MPPTPSMGRMARERTMNPMPPSHWVRARQKRMLGGSASMLMRMVAPVVVKPLIVSKTASRTEGMAPLRRKGRAPNMAKAPQPKVTTANPSRTERSLRLRQVFSSVPPRATQTRAETRKLHQTPSSK
jgi:hypothetical protein